jgi:hypothetical protein
VRRRFKFLNRFFIQPFGFQENPHLNDAASVVIGRQCIDFMAPCPREVVDGVFSVAMVITLFFLFLVYVGFWAAHAAQALQCRE